MKIYGSTISPFVRKVAAFANEKRLDYELVAVGLGSTDPEFLAASPFAKIPGFRDGEFAISDSSAIVHYLDAKYPDPRLIPEAPEDRARAVWYDEYADTILAASGGKIFFNRVVAPRFLKRAGDEAAAQQGVDELLRLFDYLESVVPGAGGFLVGGALSLADIAVASPFVNLSHCDIEIDAGKHPRLAGYIASILARPSFARLIATDKRILAA